MFQQMDEETFQRLRDESGLCVNDAMRVLEELHLYRELGTLQQLSYATDAAGELREVLGQWQRLQPSGSPPPGGAAALATWIRVETAKRISAIESERDTLRAENEAFRTLCSEYASALDQIASLPHAPDAYIVARAAREKP